MGRRKGARNVTTVWARTEYQKLARMVAKGRTVSQIHEKLYAGLHCRLTTWNILKRLKLKPPQRPIKSPMTVALRKLRKKKVTGPLFIRAITEARDAGLRVTSRGSMFTTFIEGAPISVHYVTVLKQAKGLHREMRAVVVKRAQALNVIYFPEGGRQFILPDGNQLGKWKHHYYDLNRSHIVQPWPNEWQIRDAMMGVKDTIVKLNRLSGGTKELRLPERFAAYTKPGPVRVSRVPSPPDDHLARGQLHPQRPLGDTNQLGVAPASP